MLKEKQNRIFTVLLSLIVLLPTLAVGLPSQADTPVAYGTQTYERFEAQKYAASDVGIAGNGDGREVSADVNHTPGGSKSIKLTLNGYKSSMDTPQTVVLDADGSRLLLSKGTRYTVVVWLYSETAVSLKYRIASVKEPNNVGWGPRNMEKEIVIDLPAGEWKQVVTDLTITGVSGENAAYLTVGATYSASTSQVGAVYVDDLQVQEYVDFSALDYQTYESFEAQKYGASDVGIAGNGDGREISTDVNHTPGGFKSVKLTLNGYKSSGETPQTVALGKDNTRLLLNKGGRYTVAVWLYSPTAISVKYRIASVKEPNNVAWGLRTLEKELVFDLPAGEWKRVVTNLTLAGISGESTAYLTVGATYAESTSQVGTVYVDDLQVQEYVDTSDYDYQTYESYDAMQHPASSGGIAGNGDGREVSAEQNHTPNGFKSVKLTSKGNKSLHETPQTVALTPTGAWLTVTKGKTYTVSAWLYSAKAVSVKYRIASVKEPNNVTWGVRALEQEMVLNLPAGKWTEVTAKITAVGVSGQDTAYITLGVTFANTTSDIGYFYVDDVKIAEYVPASPVTTFNGGMLYTGGKVGSLDGLKGSAVYDYDGVPCTALRVAADYPCVDRDPSEVLYDNTAWTVVGRGVLLNYSTNLNEGGTPTVEDAASYKMKNYVTGAQLQSYWRLENDTVRYSVLIKNLSKEAAQSLYLTWRAYMVITDGTNEVTVYGDTVSDVTAQMLYDAAVQQGNDVAWFAKE